MIIVLHGDESFIAAKRLKELKRAYHKKIGGDFNYYVFESQETDFKDIKQAITNNSLFSEPSFLVVKNTTENNNLKKQLAEYDYDEKTLKQKNTVLVFLEKKSIKKDSDYKKILKKATKVEVFNKLSKKEGVEWLCGYFKNKKINFERVFIAKVLELCGENIELACNELEKIFLYKNKKDSNLHISDDELSLLGVGKREAQIFPTIDAIFGGDINLALYNLQLHWEKGEAPQGVFGMIEKQLNNIATVKEQKEKGLKKDEIAKKTNLHPYVVQKTLPTADRFSWFKIKDLYNRVESLELKNKRGKIDAYLACELFSAATAS